jgi:hypothetical protein
MMTSLKAMLARLLERGEPEADLPEPGFDYRIYWTKRAMEWPPEQQARILEQVGAYIDQPDFNLQAPERLYKLPELGDEHYTGASIIELEAVLRALQAVQNDEEIL